MENKNYFTPYALKLLTLKEVGRVKIYMEYVVKLPDTVKSILTASETADYLEDTLGPAYQLSENQIVALTAIIHDILCGQVSGNLEETVAQKLTVDGTTANRLLNQLAKELLAPAIEDIKKVRQEKFPDRIRESEPAQSPGSSPPIPVNQNNIVNLRDK
ncbi:MAG: hypothetical protein UX77_C0010G0025 [Parcubacteria group bacterium GW2011_GWA1_47_11]|uniref:Uncharacterized protein n=1 Tax=Candidatus Yanofskybacteria bacterium RIFCSPHIGHO2_01_FULL_48_25b TaxID=1802672 RepID=A0A1F8F1G7_9BACT|nr:MAG: hypothetical protein UX77_C0010G0025 [Parcubacteria group bacterium GW2011_GWA1_47_11]OGN06430.1 MAG: hypothetical protein A2669_01545 [Candidatus Yanofskybacteria bacterium RIFCSPHIGHO2_01_FULL_48_25b]